MGKMVVLFQRILLDKVITMIRRQEPDPQIIYTEKSSCRHVTSTNSDVPGVSGAWTLYKQVHFVTTLLPFFPFILILYSPFVTHCHMDLT
jgi:hypothetical protein